MNNFFCKVEDLNKNQYILTDKFKQPLECHRFKNTCHIANLKKVINVLKYGLISVSKSPSLKIDTKLFAVVKLI